MTINIERILVPVELGPRTEELVHFACRVADAFDAEVEVVHACPPAIFPTGKTAEGDDAYLGAKRWRTDDVRSQVERAGGPGRKIPIHVLEGLPDEVIPAAATAYRADLIVMRESTTSGFKRLLAGRTSDLVSHRSPVPVLIVPEPGEGRPLGEFDASAIVPPVERPVFAADAKAAV